MSLEINVFIAIEWPRRLQRQVTEVIQLLPKSLDVQEIPCQTVFRFGNSSTVQCDRALLIPLGPYFVKICIVPSKTPFLLSNNFFRKLEASIHTATDEIHQEAQSTTPTEIVRNCARFRRSHPPRVRVDRKPNQS